MVRPAARAARTSGAELAAAPAAAAPAWQQPQQQPAWPGQQPQQYAAPPAKKKGNVLGGLLAFLGAILLVVGSFTQWVRTNVETITGWEASVDGKVVVGLAVIALLIGLALIAGVRSIVLRLALLALGVWAIVIAIVDIIDVGNQLDSLEPAAGVGLYLVGAAGGRPPPGRPRHALEVTSQPEVKRTT